MDAYLSIAPHARKTDRRGKPERGPARWSWAVWIDLGIAGARACLMAGVNFASDASAELNAGGKLAQHRRQEPTYPAPPVTTRPSTTQEQP
jgi:hypothetical protein